jgi:hypothetical protein
MGTISFNLPAGLPPEAARALERACIIGGPDNMPWPTKAVAENGQLSLQREVDESGCVVAPWEIANAGRLMTATGTLMERRDAYSLPVELARGKVNQVRCQAADWQMGGLTMSPALAEQIRVTSQAFGRAATGASDDAAGALASAYRDADQLVKLYIDQMFQARHQRQPRLETMLGSRLGPAPLAADHADPLIQASNSVCLPFDWKEVEVEEGSYRWEGYDALLDWAEKQGLAVTGGPLVTFSKAQLPEWIWIWERDVSSVSAFLCEYAEAVVRRYRNRIRTWQLCTASNCANVLGLTEDEMLWLTVRMAEAVRQVDPNLGLIVGISQPWGDYMAAEERTHSPFIFADTLIRSGLNLAGLDLEIVMGAGPNGSYCRDLLEASRLIDLYTLLGTPLRLTLGYPSAGTPAPETGYWRRPFSPEGQAEWAAEFAAVAICKPSVRGVHWVHASDAVPHHYPHAGLFDAEGKAKPILKALHDLRENHLR